MIMHNIFRITRIGYYQWPLTLDAKVGSGPKCRPFSKSVLDIRTRLVVSVVPGTKWMPNPDSASKLMPKCKILAQYDLKNYFHSCLKLPFSEIFI